MAKDIITELIDELTKLRDEEMKQVAKAIEDGKNPPIPMKPAVVMKKVYEVARHHQMTADELGFLMDMQGSYSAQSKTVVDDYAKKLESEE